MPGTVTVVLAPRVLGRAGKIGILVDGSRVGKVRQGASLDLSLDPGEYRFRIASWGYRSGEVRLTVAEDSAQQVYAGIHPGARMLLTMSSLVVGWFTGVLGAALFIAILAAIPGWYFFLRASELSPSAQDLEDAEEAAVRAGSEEPWWVTDPVLSKRNGKSAP